MTETKRVDLGEGIKKPEQSQTDNTISNTTEALQKELEQADPLLGMITHQIFAQGRMISDLADELSILKQKNAVIEKHLGYLISKDPEFIAHFQGSHANDKKK